MKTFLRILATILLISNSAVGLTACSIPNIGDVWIITDGGDLFDKAFNQQVFSSAQQFATDFNDNRTIISNLPNNKQWKNKSMVIRWIISHDSEVSTLQNNYNLAVFAGAKTIILSGFHHLAAMTPAIQNHYKNLGVRFILVDAKLDHPIDVAGLTYSAEQSAFLAGLAGAIWLAANEETYGTNGGLKMSTFGGLPADTIVSYMMGYYWGVEYFNEKRKSDINLLNLVNKIRIKINLPRIEDNLALAAAKYNIDFYKNKNQFTNSFDSGTKESKGITTRLINDEKNDIVMPVAGGQTIDLVSAITNSAINSNAKIIGVDVDQSVQYGYAKEMFITSALKGIHKSVYIWLWHAFNLSYDNNSQTPTFKKDNDTSQYFDGTTQPVLDGKNYTGIANNSAIATIYQDLTMGNTYWKLAQKVSEVYKKLYNDLATSTENDKWKQAWQDDVDLKSSYRPQF